LFYTDGKTVYNKQHLIMKNGTDLKGDASSTQSALIVPNPNSTTIYYIFTVDEQAGPDGLNYSEVDLSLDGGLGAITSNKNINLTPRSTEQVTAVLHSNGTDIWVLTHPWDSYNFNSFLVTSLGVNTTPVISSTPLHPTWPPNSDGTNSACGQLKVSPDGKKIGICNENRGTHIFDFDNTTGIISNMIQVSTRSLDYGLEFSSSGKRMYVTSALGNSFDGIHSLFQYNIEANDVASSEILIAKQFSLGSSLQLGPDKKIYAALAGTTFLSSIEEPNRLGVTCKFIPNSVSLDGRMSQHGLPPFIQSFFLTISPFEFENLCFGKTTQFT